MMEIFMKVNGEMIWLMVEVFIFILTAVNMKENGKIIYKMVSV
jgi:hypothetical protein